MSLRRFWIATASIGAAGGAYFLFARRALATEDESGDVVPAREAVPLPVLPSAAAPSLGAKAVEVLSRYVGKAKGNPKGSHRNPFIDEIVMGVRGDGKKFLGKPWCALAARFAFEKAATELSQPPPFAAIKSSLAAVTDWRDLFKAHHAMDPRPSMVGLILHGGVRHATIVSRVDGGRVYTVEGNHGDAAAFVKRSRTSFDFFVDVDGYVRGADRTRVTGLDYALGCDLLGVRLACTT